MGIKHLMKKDYSSDLIKTSFIFVHIFRPGFKPKSFHECEAFVLHAFPLRSEIANLRVVYYHLKLSYCAPQLFMTRRTAFSSEDNYFLYLIKFSYHHKRPTTNDRKH